MDATTMIAGTLARTEAIRAEIQPLLDELEQTRAQLRAQRSAHTRALKRAQEAEAQTASLWNENARLALLIETGGDRPVESLYATQEATSESDGIYSTTDIELTRLAQTLAALKREDHERWARHICAALNYVEALDRELRRETGRDRRPTRQIDPLRRQGRREVAA
jgi:hypothetical protein